MSELSGEGSGPAPLTTQIETAIKQLESLNESSQLSDHEILESFGFVASLADEAVFSGELDREKTARIKLEAARTARSIALSSGHRTATVSLNQLVEAYQAVVDLMDTNPTEQPANTSQERTGSAKTRI